MKKFNIFRRKNDDEWGHAAYIEAQDADEALELFLNASRAGEPAEYECTIAGRCCESGDRVAEYVSIAKPERGDIIAVLTTGAYNYAMASNYNRIPKPAMIMIKDGKARLVVKRETYADLMKNEL